MQAYSQPMTPAPTMVKDLGSRFNDNRPSLSMIESSSKGISAGRAGSVPTPMTT